MNEAPALFQQPGEWRSQRELRKEVIALTNASPSKDLQTPDEPWMSRGFISKIASQVSLPYKRPKTKEVERHNGTLMVRYSTSEDCLPYGRYPRLFELWACSMIKTGNECFDPDTRTLHLGGTFREFLRLIGINVGGKSLHTIKPQLERLFACKYFIKNIADPSKSQGYQFVVANQWNIDWLKEQSERNSCFDNWVKLSQEYVDMLADNPVPVDLATIAKLRKPMALDIYMWLTKRVYGLVAPTHITWEQLYKQFGSETKELREFKRSFKEALEEVIAVYPCRVVCGRHYISVWPNITSVPTSEETQQINRERAKTLQVAHSSEQRQKTRAKATESARAGKWFSLFGQSDQIWWCSEAWDINAAQDHLYGIAEQGDCPVCAYDKRNRERHGSWPFPFR